MYSDPLEYPVDMVRPFMGTEWSEFSFTLEKSELVNALKRLSIFTKPWQKGKVILTFDKESVTLLGENQDVNETISIKLKGTPCRMVTSAEEMLIVLRKLNSEFVIYGSQKCIGLEDNISLYVLSTIEEEG